MKRSQALLITFLLLLSTGIIFGAEKNSEISDPDLSKALIKGFNKLTETYENTDPKDIEAYQKTSTESMMFLYYLVHCQNAIQTPKSGMKSMYTAVHPPSFDLKLKYPLFLKAEITPKNETDNPVVLLLSKETVTAGWQITDGWIQNNIEERVGKVAIPSAVQQKKANEELPRLVKDTCECKCD